MAAHIRLSGFGHAPNPLPVYRYKNVHPKTLCFTLLDIKKK
jgi:hypothetical protein